MAVGDRGEVLARPLLELVEACLADESEGHEVGAVVGLVEGEQLLVCGSAERVAVAGAEMVCRVAGDDRACASTWYSRQMSFSRFFWFSELTAFISRSVNLGVKQRAR